MQTTLSGESALTIDDLGVTISSPESFIPWKQITEVRDVGEAFFAFRRYRKAIPILKRALPDNGNALLAALDEKLTASRYLVRGTVGRKRTATRAV